MGPLARRSSPHAVIYSGTQFFGGILVQDLLRNTAARIDIASHAARGMDRFPAKPLRQSVHRQLAAGNGSKNYVFQTIANSKTVVELLSWPNSPKQTSWIEVFTSTANRDCTLSTRHPVSY
jgi:hypothetical protein